MFVVRLLLLSFIICALRADGEDPIAADFDDDDDFVDADASVSDSDVDSAAPDADETAEEGTTPPVTRVRPIYAPPVPQGDTYFAEAFESEASFRQRWVLSKSKKDGVDAAVSKYDGQWSVEEPTDNPLQNDLGLILMSRAKHHAISARLDKPFDFSGKPLVVQYEVKFQNGQECGGAYIKLLSKDDKLDLNNFHDKTPYTIMFGPDKCGNDHKLHFIFRHKNPLKGTLEEKHAKKPTATLDSYFSDKKTHLYTLVVNSDNSFQVYVDHTLVNSGSLLSDVSPPVNPPKEIADPDDKKPADWDERERVPDPDAVKPEDWDEDAPEMIEDTSAVKPDGWLDDEPELVPDSTAEKPSDWDDDTDGEWEPPMINNPKCESAPGCGEWKPPKVKNPDFRGKWIRPTMDNPNYKGKWSPRMIPNPEFFEDLTPYKMTPIVAVGLELWSMSNGIVFDNFIITDDKKVADRWAADSWQLKKDEELAASGGFVQSVIDATHERPWLWAVIIVVVVLPVVLIIVYCCLPGSSKDDETARRKKTDEPSPDGDAGEEEEPEEEEEVADESSELVQNEAAAAKDAAATETAEPGKPDRKKQTKADLEVKEDEVKDVPGSVGDASEAAAADITSPQAKGDGSD
jgi:calnexin